MDRHIVIFGTRDIASDRPLYEGQIPVFDGRVRRWVVRQYSTGRLERALSSGMEVYVCSIRPGFDLHDEWWRKLVPEERVFAAELRPGRYEADRVVWAVECGPWKRLFDHLGLPWNDAWRREEGPRAYVKATGILLGEHFAASAASS